LPSASHVRIHDWLDPHATLAAWSGGPWAAEAAGGDPGVLGLPAEPFTGESRQWLALQHGRAREQCAGLIVVKDGPRWGGEPLDPALFAHRHRGRPIHTQGECDGVSALTA
jgi:hypothetical protein